MKYKQGRLTLAYNGINALNVSKYKGLNRIDSNMKHSDIISAMKRPRMNLLLDISCVHVKGHQDDEKEFGDLIGWCS